MTIVIPLIVGVGASIVYIGGAGLVWKWLEGDSIPNECGPDGDFCYYPPAGIGEHHSCENHHRLHVAWATTAFWPVVSAGYFLGLLAIRFAPAISLPFRAVFHLMAGRADGEP